MEQTAPLSFRQHLKPFMSPLCLIRTHCKHLLCDTVFNDWGSRSLLEFKQSLKKPIDSAQIQAVS